MSPFPPRDLLFFSTNDHGRWSYCFHIFFPHKKHSQNISFRVATPSIYLTLITHSPQRQRRISACFHYKYVHPLRQFISVSNMKPLLYQKLWSTLEDLFPGAWLAMALLVMQHGKMWCGPWRYLSWAFSSYICSFFLGTSLCVFVFSWPCKSSCWLSGFKMIHLTMASGASSSSLTSQARSSWY